MKNRPLLFIAMLFVFFACTTNENQFLDTDGTTALQNNQNRNYEDSVEVASFADSPEPEIEPIDNQIIIKYKLDVTEDEKEALREKYNVISYENCHCADNITIWNVGVDIDIEPTVKVINSGNNGSSGNNGGEPLVDYASENFKFFTPMHNVNAESIEAIEDYPINNPFHKLYLDRIKSINDGITIAVLDSGIDVDYPGFLGAFLYNSSEDGCKDEKSGWDFVNGDSNPFDDNPKIHGTGVSYIIHEKLREKGIPHQILPLKIADANGSIKFSDYICALNYAINRNADVINKSFGWYGANKYMEDMISSFVDNTSAIIVTSAGNSGSDNDVIQHFPSGLTQNNVLSIAAAKNDFSNATLFSNYGSSSVDFFALGKGIPFPLNQQNTHVTFRGTSFAAPDTSALVAELLFSGNQDMRLALRQQYGLNIDYNKQVFYNMLLR
jgi:hypothetical protein